MRLCLISHRPFWYKNEELVSPGGFVREFDYWARLFDDVVLCVPVHYGVNPPAGAYAFEKTDVEVVPLAPFVVAPRGFAGIHKIVMTLLNSYRIDKMLRRIYRIPGNIMRLLTMIKAIARCDAVCLACPVDTSLMGLIARIITRKRCCAYYGGDWYLVPDRPERRRLKRALTSG